MVVDDGGDCSSGVGGIEYFCFGGSVGGLCNVVV